jgi:hypothetical protein
MAIYQPAVGGGGLRTEAAVLNNPAAGRMPTLGKAPCSGVLSTGREPHAIPGVTLPVAVILTAPRLRSPRHPARQTAWDLGDEGHCPMPIGFMVGSRIWLGRFRPGRPSRFANLPLAGSDQGGKGLPLGNPGPWRMPTVGKSPGSGILSTGREPHAIHGVTLPFAVILTAHRFRSPRHPARQTAWSFGLSETSKSGV